MKLGFATHTYIQRCHYCCEQLWSAYFSDDERLAVLEPSFQGEPPRRAPTQLDLNVVERHELFDRFHSLSDSGPFCSFTFLSLCRFC